MPENYEYALRRAKFLKKLPEGSITIVSSAPERLRNGDSYYPYRQNSDFYYLTGFKEPQAVAVFIPGRKEGEFVLFCRARDPERETWDGIRAGQEGACQIYGADQSFPFESLDQHMPLFFENRQRLYYAIGRDMRFNNRVLSWLSVARKQVRKGITVPQEFVNVEKIIHAMRLRKTSVEIALMRKAGQISAKAHCAAMKVCKPGLYEYDLEAEIQAVLTRNGSRSPAYNHIVGAGQNACVLHYVDNHAQIQDGDIVLIDAGAEYDYYAADITRTFPANGRFTPVQRVIYEAVLTTQLAVIKMVKPGLSWNELHKTSEIVMTEELLRLGLLKGQVDALISTRAYQKFYMHGVSHWLGMDVHDVGNYRDDQGQWQTLEPGMVFTVEPGIYIPAHTEDVAEKWWNIGVRIEDDILVTETGYEILSADAPKTVEDIETLMNNNQ